MGLDVEAAEQEAAKAAAPPVDPKAKVGGSAFGKWDLIHGGRSRTFEDVEDGLPRHQKRF